VTPETTIKDLGEQWKLPLIIFMGSVDQSLQLKLDSISVLDRHQLRALGFLRITQPMSIASSSKKGAQRILTPQLILVVVAIYHTKNQSWLPGVYDNKSEFMEASRCATGRGSMIGLLRKGLLDNEKSRAVDGTENIPVVIVDDHYSLHWLSADNSRQAPNDGSYPPTPQKSIRERAAAIREKLQRKKTSQFGTSRAAPPSTPAPALLSSPKAVTPGQSLPSTPIRQHPQLSPDTRQLLDGSRITDNSGPTDKDMSPESPLSPTPYGMWKPYAQIRLLTFILQIP
jgi:hypothetical protein